MDGTYTIFGEGHWMKVLGPPVRNYDATHGGSNPGREHTFEIKPNAEGREILERLGVADRINKGDNKDRILFRHREKRADGTLNRPLAIVDTKNRPWPENKLIGNGSGIEVKFRFVDNGKGRKDSLYPQGIRIHEYIEYVPQVFDEPAEGEPDEWGGEPLADFPDEEVV